MNGDTPRRFLVEHLSDFRYEQPAQGSLMVLRLHPREDGGQHVANFTLDIDPPPRRSRSRTPSATPVTCSTSIGRTSTPP